MNFYVLTLFPEMIHTALNHSVIGRAIQNNRIYIEAINIRDFANNKHKQVDDYPYGGGAGMVMQPQPVYDAYKHVLNKTNKSTRVLYLTPKGKTLNQKMVNEFAKEENLILLCGHYEGIDERVIEEIVTDEVSVGDYVLTGGELGAMIVIDSVSRLQEGVLNNDHSSVDESFSNGLLEYPQYTRPREFNEKIVPEVLLSGHHEKINKWRREKSLEITLNRRPDLLKTVELSEDDKGFLYKYLKNVENK